MATNIDEMDEEPGPGGRVIDSYGGVSLHRQSHGESFLSLVEHRFGGQGLYLLDEPEAALSPSRLMTLLVHIRHLVGQDSQFLIATHSPILMAYPGACIYQLSEAGIARVDYRDTEHYRLTRRFLEAPEPDDGAARFKSCRGGPPPHCQKPVPRKRYTMPNIQVLDPPSWPT